MTAYRTAGRDPEPPKPDYDPELEAYAKKLYRQGARRARLQNFPWLGWATFLAIVVGLVGLHMWTKGVAEEHDRECARKGGTYLHREQICMRGERLE